MRRHKNKDRRQLRRQDIYRKVRKFISGFAMCIFIVSFAIPLLAEEAAKPSTEEPKAGNAGEKLAEGVEETATGWVEVPKEVAETSEETNPVEGVTVGAVKGAGEAVAKTAEGAVKAATFYIPDEKQQEQKEQEEKE